MKEKIEEEKRKKEEEIKKMSKTNADLTNQLTELQKFFYQFKLIKNELDMDKDGKLSPYEIVVGLLTVPKFLAIVFGLIASVYGVYQTIKGIVSTDWDVVGLVISGVLILSMFVFYFVIRKLTYSNVETIRKLNTNHEMRYKQLRKKYDDLKIEYDKLKQENNNLISILTLKTYALGIFQKNHPSEVPNIALEDKYNIFMKKHGL